MIDGYVSTVIADKGKLEERINAGVVIPLQINETIARPLLELVDESSHTGRVIPKNPNNSEIIASLFKYLLTRTGEEYFF